MRVEHLQHLHLPVPADVKVRHPAIDSYQDTAGLLKRADEAADELVGDAFCECLKLKKEILMEMWGHIKCNH